MKIQIKNTGRHPLPAYQTAGAAAFDIAANLAAPLTLGSLERKLIPTGLFIAVPDGYEAQIRPRSGLALKHGLSVINTPGTIDSDYRGELCVVLINLSKDSYIVQDGDRIAQVVVAKCERVEWDEVTELSSTQRGESGFGHTGHR